MIRIKTAGNLNNRDKIGAPVLFFSLYIAIMLYQPEGIGTIVALATLVLIALSCVFSGRVSLLSFRLPITSLFILAYLILISFVTFLKGNDAPSYYKFAAQILLFLVLAAVSISKREHEFLKWVFIGASVFYAILTIYYCWQEGADLFYHPKIVLFGVSFDPNFIGLPFVATLALLLDKILNSHHRVLCIILYFVVAFAIVLTSSRGSTVAWVVSSAIVIFLYMKSREIKSKKRWFWVAFFFALFAVFVYFASTFYAQQWARMSNITTEVDNGRLELWRRTIAHWKDSPFFGNGLRSMYLAFGRASHNTYLQVLIDGGLIGIALFLGFLFFLAKNSGKADKIMIAVLCGLLIQIMFLDSIDNRVVWILFCWIAMLKNGEGVNANAEEVSQENSAQPPAEKTVSPRQKRLDRS